jgi:hypothetical protein
MFIHRRHVTGGLSFGQEARMEVFETDRRTANNSERRALLYVTDSVSDSPEFLALAIKLAQRQGDRLELLHVIDPGQTPSMPDALMGLQYSIETLARSLKALKRNAHALLLFGCPEDVISRRAADIDATLLAFPLDRSERDLRKKKLAHRLIEKCTCPIVTFSVFSIAAKRRGLLHLKAIH